MLPPPDNMTRATARRCVPYLVAGAVAAASAVSLAGAASGAPTGPDTVSRTVQSLQAHGYNVIVNKVGAAALDECTVSAVRPGQTHDTIDSRGGGSLHTTVISRTVYVDVTC